jgi:hypothetical protein
MVSDVEEDHREDIVSGTVGSPEELWENTDEDSQGGIG